jgi:hypothetical protein
MKDIDQLRTVVAKVRQLGDKVNTLEMRITTHIDQIV